LLLVAAVAALAAGPQIAINEKEYFEGPGFSFLVFHNNYQVGYQGGLQMIQQEERLLDSGDLFLDPPRGGESFARRVLKREVDRPNSTATVFGEIMPSQAGYRIKVRTDGARMVITLSLDKPVDWAKTGQAGFQIYLYPGAYYDKSFQSDQGSGVFPRQYLEPVLVRGAHWLRVAEEDKLRSFAIRRVGGTLDMTDSRDGSPQTWFAVRAPIAKGSTETEVRVEITPSIDPDWRRPAVIGISQVGYHPNQPKRAILELDPRDKSDAPVVLAKLEPDGARVVKSAPPQPWGRFLRYEYATFDFSDVRDPGLYTLEYHGQTAGPFRITSSVYDGAWQPTLEYFLPVQMCHVMVREGTRVWHGACHLDDALQAPAGKIHIDGYQQGPERETRFKDNEHIPGLDWGGWHDAGDHDLPAGSFAETVLPLALALEEFHPMVDRTSVQRADRLVQLHVPDGKADIVQQIEYGIEGMLASFRVGGHIFSGIIESTPRQYSHLGDPVTVTDNKVYDPPRNPKRDDRWVFTNRNTGLQYEVAQALAASARAIKEHSPALTKEALDAAGELWEYEQSHPPVYPLSGYNPADSGFRAHEIAATAELLLTTGEARYRERLMALLPGFRNLSGRQFESIGGAALVRVLPVVKDAEFRSAVTALARKWKDELGLETASNPYGVPYPKGVSSPEFKLEGRSGIHSSFVWGHGWDLQSEAMNTYFFHKHMPDLFGPETVFNVVNFVLGCHPASNESFVSGVGGHSATIAYGFNRADWSHIPGGVISGTSLIKPDYMELKEFPFLWYQTEYVISGAATYIFDVLAAERLAGGGGH
jgi:hypothetical protein